MNLDDKLKQIQEQAVNGGFKKSHHANEEMKDESINEEAVLEALASGQILEDYPTHKRGACGLVGGIAKDGRPIHIVCTTSQSPLIIITVYEPKLPWWITPTQRRSKQ